MASDIIIWDQPRDGSGWNVLYIVYLFWGSDRELGHGNDRETQEEL